MSAAFPGSIRNLLNVTEATVPPRTGESLTMGQLRQQGLDAFLRQGFATQGREDWKYGDITPLARGSFAPFAGITQSTVDFRLYLSEAATYKLVFINGIFDAGLSNVETLPRGVILQPLAQVAESDLGQLADFEQSPVTALNTAFWQDGLFLDVAEGVALDRPVELFFLTDEQATETMVASRNLIHAGKGSSLTVVEHFTGPLTGQVFNAPVTEITCGEDSVVRHLKVIRESQGALHFGSSHVRQLVGSNYTSLEFALGGSSVRRELHLDLEGSGASCDLTALYMASGSQRMDLRTRVSHNVPGCRTNELYKGILDGEARAVFDGLIKVAPDAQQTEAFQTNRNLMLSDDTISYSIPRLEIYADDVKCSHGSTTGQLDDEQLFFLRSRGFEPHTARIMLANAFASEVIEGVRDAELRNLLAGEITTRLGSSSVRKEKS